MCETASVVQWSEFLATDLEVPGSILAATRLYENIVGMESGSLSLVKITEEPLEVKSSGCGLENRDNSH
jgi:hypothetical protein